MIMKQLPLVLCTLILVVSGVQAQTPIPSESLAWKTYTVKGEDFSVALPVLPALHISEEFSRRIQRTRKIHQLGSYADGVIYTIMVFENPKPRESLDDFVDKHSASNLWDKGTKRDVTLDGFAGKEILSANRASGVVQFFAAEDRLYEFAAVGTPEDDPRVKKFLASVLLRKKDDGEKVPEGPGGTYVPVIESGTSNWSAADQQLFVGKQVDRKVVLGMKPEPRYTEEARQNGVTGTVVMKCIFSSNGSVYNIRIVSGLPFGLTERAIDAARKIKFIPAVKDGKYVSMWMQLEYNFNLY